MRQAARGLLSLQRVHHGRRWVCHAPAGLPIRFLWAPVSPPEKSVPVVVEACVRL